MARILVIDDDPMYREMVSEALADDGHDVQWAENGLEGIDKARAYVPELVISDVVMEGADGYEVLTRLRNEPSTAGIPFIMMTGWSSKGGQRQGMSMGADDYLAKPFNASELLDSVRAQLRKRQRMDTQLIQHGSMSEVGTSVLLPAEVSCPLQTLSGVASILNDSSGQLTLQDTLSLGRSVSDSVWRIRRAVDNFVLYSQLTALEQDEDARNDQLNHEVRDISLLIENSAHKVAAGYGRGNDLQLSLSDGSLPIASEYLQRMIDELLDNACKFSPEGSPIELLTVFAPKRFGISVTDHGVGMTEEAIARIDAFVQDGKRDLSKPGLGLGLAIVRRIAVLHQGAMYIRSKHGEKTVVSVELPVRR